jgi:geranylgeranyl diphosphate synthase type II
VAVLLIAEMIGVSEEIVLPYACAIEMIHTYSLIHDDLPCMDNDDFRRGFPSCHVAFSESTALLAGDALLNRAYEVLIEQCVLGGNKHARAALLIAEAAGMKGMIGGQTIDMASIRNPIDSDGLYELHQKKTGALISAAFMVSMYLSGNINKREVMHQLFTDYSRHVGLSYQIMDDILDVQSNREHLGKSIGKDDESNKSTFVTIFGIDQAKTLYENEMQSAQCAIDEMEHNGYNINLLSQFTEYLHNRDM